MNILDQIRKDKSYSPFNSQQWFMGKVREMTGGQKVTSMQMLAQNRKQQTTRIMPGQMMMFVYDPKFKEELPLYDKFPLLLPFNKDHNSFIGLNLHYLPPMSRLGLLHKLMEIAKFDKMGAPKNLALTWTFLKTISKQHDVEKCVKRYLNGHVKSNFIRIEPRDYASAVMLPSENFAKKRPW